MAPRTTVGVKKMGAGDPIFSRPWGQKISDFLGVEMANGRLVLRSPVIKERTYYRKIW